MPTTNPRVSITLEHADLAIIDRFAAASGTPRATVLAGLVHSVLPQLESAAELIELANDAPSKVQQELAESLALATENVMGSLAGVQTVYRGAMDKMKGKGKPPAAVYPLAAAGRKGVGSPRPGPAADRPASDPHLLTGGSNFTRKGSRK